jgi:hypothetical protein
MRLYHFTCEEGGRLAGILQYGIVKGDVPLTMFRGINAPWLTDDPNPGTQEWIASTPKNSVRLTVRIPKKDRRLQYWPTYAKEQRVEGWWYESLDRAGGGGSQHWYVYLGKIPPSMIEKVEILRPASLRMTAR